MAFFLARRRGSAALRAVPLPCLVKVPLLLKALTPPKALKANTPVLLQVKLFWLSSVPPK